MSSNPGSSPAVARAGCPQLERPAARRLPRVKKAIRSVSIEQCRQIAERVMKLEAARDVDMYLLDRLGEFVPELIVN